MPTGLYQIIEHGLHPYRSLVFVVFGRSDNAKVSALYEELVQFVNDTEFNLLIDNIEDDPKPAKPRDIPLPSNVENFFDTTAILSDVAKALLDDIGNGTRIMKQINSFVGSSVSAQGIKTNASQIADALQLACDTTNVFR